METIKCSDELMFENLDYSTKSLGTIRIPGRVAFLIHNQVKMKTQIIFEVLLSLTA